MSNILDLKFSHHKFFRGCSLTRKQALEGLAVSGDVVLTKRPSKTQSPYLFAEPVYDDVLYCGESHCTYRVTPEEKAFFEARKDFWTCFNSNMNNLWEHYKGNANGGLMAYLEHRKSEMMNVPEYLDYITEFEKQAQ